MTEKLDLLKALSIAADFANKGGGSLGPCVIKQAASFPEVIRKDGSAATLTIAARDGTTIAKRAASTEEFPPMIMKSDMESLIAQADWAMKKGDLDLCENLLNKAEKLHKRKSKFSFTHDDGISGDGTVDDTWQPRLDDDLDHQACSIAEL
jgi:hypothetical protein